MKTKLVFVPQYLRKSIFFLVLFFQISNGFSQDYRNASAYINDFGRNETNVNSALMEYSKSIAFVDPEKRLQRSLDELILKFEKLNSILNIHDKGYKNDESLKNSLIDLNISVIEYLKNEDNDMNDYKEQSLLSLAEIENNFRKKDVAIELLYSKFRKYENTKRQFGIKYNIPIKNDPGFNIYEYNTNQNLIFYKINVLDEKLLVLIDNKDVIQIKECAHLIVSTCNQSLQKTAIYKDYFSDRTLNDANIAFSEFFLNQDEVLIPVAVNFLTFSEQFQKTKCLFEENNGIMTIEEYNTEVRKYNDLKNKFNYALFSVNVNKNPLIDSWLKINSDFLKNNINFDIDNYRYVDTD